MIAAGGLAGKVTRVTGGTAEVSLITDGSSAVSAQVMPNGANGIVKPEVGKPDDLLLDFVAEERAASPRAPRWSPRASSPAEAWSRCSRAASRSAA